MELNTEDSNDPDTQLSEMQAARETMPRSKLRKVRMLSHLSECDRGSKDHILGAHFYQ